MTQTGSTAVFLGILITVIPFSFLLRLLQQQPKALALSHKRWPLALNGVLAIAVMIAMILFFKRAFEREMSVQATAFEFVIAAAVYAFGLVLMLRQFCGFYEEFIITVAVAGLSLRRIAYRNIVGVDRVENGGGEAQLRIRTARGETLTLMLPVAHLERFYAQVQKKNSVE